MQGGTTPAEQHTNQLEWLFADRGTEIAGGFWPGLDCDWPDRLQQDIVEVESCGPAGGLASGKPIDVVTWVALIRDLERGILV